jgi:hypothetical protein
MQQVAPGSPPQYTQGHNSASNIITAAVGPRFALVPKVYPYAEGCGNPVLPQSISIVAVGDISSPMHLRQVVNQVNSSAQPAPFTSHIPQSTCLCFNEFTKGVFDEQQVMDAGGSPVFSLAVITHCCRNPTFSVLDAQKVEVGHLEYIPMPCGIACAYACCGLVCRTPETPQWAWLAALDAHGRERLTFRHEAQEGKCVCCAWQMPASQGCCANIPDFPWHDKQTLYGPMPEKTNKLGEINVRGSYGYDSSCCGMVKTFGVRPEMMAEINLSAPLSFEDTTLAIQMALQRTQAQLEWRNVHGQRMKLPFLKPGQVTMQ